MPTCCSSGGAAWSASCRSRRSPPAISPTDAEIAAFYRANRVAFTVPERRVIKYAVIGMEQVAADRATPPTPRSPRSTATARSYGARETRTLQAIVLPSQQAAQAFAARVRGGADFVAAAAQAGFAAGDVTFADQNRAQFERVANAEVAAAAFAAAQGAVAGPIRSELGYHVVRVERIIATPGRPLEAVRGEIAAAIESRKRTEALGTLVSRVEERLSDGASFEEAARAEHLAIVTTPPITAAGQPGGGSQWVRAPELRPMLRSAFEIDAEDPQPVVEQITPNAALRLARHRPGPARGAAAARPDRARGPRRADPRARAARQSRALADLIARRINARHARRARRSPRPSRASRRRGRSTSAGSTSAGRGSRCRRR